MTDNFLTLRLFGSRAGNANRPDSDIDVLVEGPPDEIERVKKALHDFSIEQGGPLDLFVIGSVDNEIDLVAAYSTNDDRSISVGDSHDLDQIMHGSEHVDLDYVIKLCHAIEPLWGL